MYFLRKIHEGREPRTIKVDFSEFLDMFCFWPHVYFDKKARFRQAFNPLRGPFDAMELNTIDEIRKAQDELYYVADMAASAIAQLSAAQLLTSGLVEKALTFCEQALVNRGYEQITQYGLRRIGKNDEKTVMFVPGCQNRSLLQQRCRKVAQVAVEVPVDMEVVFSGANVAAIRSEKEASVVDEAGEMSVWFERYYEEHSAGHEGFNHRSLLEKSSQRTTENVANLFKGPFFAEDRLNRVYVVSSSFHLLRIADALDKNSGANPNKKLESIVLIGSERGYRPEPVALMSAYVKGLFFEVYRNVLSVHLQIPLVVE